MYEVVECLEDLQVMLWQTTHQYCAVEPPALYCFSRRRPYLTRQTHGDAERDLMLQIVHVMLARYGSIQFYNMFCNIAPIKFVHMPCISLQCLAEPEDSQQVNGRNENGDSFAYAIWKIQDDTGSQPIDL
jgi:hypothetical protein